MLFTDLINKRLNNGRYQIQSLIGQGGVGIVYRAYDTQTRQVVALKLLNPDLLAQYSAIKRRFESEINYLQQRLNHPSIIKIYDTGTVTVAELGLPPQSKISEVPWFTMEYLDADLGYWVSTRGKLSVEEAIDCVGQIAAGVAHAHSKNTIHGDIKPDNILIKVGANNRLERAVLTDFGLAKLQDEYSSAHEGTLEYMAPDKIQAEVSTQPSKTWDTYALGLILYELVTGQKPFNQPPQNRTRHDRPAPLPNLNQLLYQNLDRIIARALQFNAYDRYADAKALANALDNIHFNEVVSTRETTKMRHEWQQPTINLLPFANGLNPFRSRTWVQNGDYRFLVAYGNQVNTHYIQNVQEITIGRGGSCQITLPSEYITEKQVTVRFDTKDHIWRVINEGATDGAALSQHSWDDFKTLEPNWPTPWGPHQMLRVGDYFIAWQARQEVDRGYVPNPAYLVQSNGYNNGYTNGNGNGYSNGNGVANGNGLATAGRVAAVAAAAVAAERAVRVSDNWYIHLPERTLELEPETLLQEVIEVENKSDTVEYLTVEIQVDGKPANWIQPEPTSFKLTPQERQPVTLNFRPGALNLLAGTHEYQIYILNKRGKRSEPARGGLALSKNVNAQARLITEHLKAEVPCQVAVKNLSNLAQDYSVEGVSHENNLDFGNAMPLVNLQPGQEATVTLPVTVTNRPMIKMKGYQTTTYDIRVLNADKQILSTLEGKIDIKPSLPFWPVMIGVPILLLLCAGLFWGISSVTNTLAAFNDTLSTSAQTLADSFSEGQGDGTNEGLILLATAVSQDNEQATPTPSGGAGGSGTGGEGSEEGTGSGTGTIEGTAPEGGEGEEAGPNEPPVLDAEPPSSGQEDVLYVYKLEASDPNGDPIQVTVEDFPLWLSWNQDTLTLSGIPSQPRDITTFLLTVKLDDGKEGVLNEQFEITIENTNDRPYFVTDADEHTAVENTSFLLEVEAADPDLLIVNPDKAETCKFTVVGPEWLEYDQDVTSCIAFLTGTPTNEDVGTHQVSVKVEDTAGAADIYTFNLLVYDENSAPTLISGQALPPATEDVLYTTEILFSDDDIDDTARVDIAQSIIPSWLSAIPGTEKVTLQGTPRNEHVGNVTIQIVVTDKSGSTAMGFALAVQNTNDAPVFSSTPVARAMQQEEYRYTITTTDPDNLVPTVKDTRTIRASRLPTWLTLSDNGDGTAVLVGRPTINDIGAYDVILVVQDAGGLTALQSFSIQVAEKNDPPSIISTCAERVDEGEFYSCTIQATDPDAGDTLTFVVSVTNPDPLAPTWLSAPSSGGQNGTVTIRGTAPRALSANQFEYNVSIEVQDALGLTASQLFVLTINNVNDSPSFGPIPAECLIAIEDVLYNCPITITDPDDGDTLTIVMDQKPTWLNLSTQASPLLNGTPGNNDVGQHTITMRVIDQLGATGSTSFAINVENRNDPPVIELLPADIAIEGVRYNSMIRASDPDVGDEVTISATYGSNSTWLDNDDPLPTCGVNCVYLQGDPENDDVGLTTFVTLHLTDGEIIDTIDIPIEIEVQNINDAPYFTGTTVFTASVGSPAVPFTVYAEDPDFALMQNLVIAPLSGLPSWLTVGSTTNTSSGASAQITINSTVSGIVRGNLTPPGSYIFSLQVTDPDGAVGTRTYQLNILNQAPELVEPLPGVGSPPVYTVNACTWSGNTLCDTITIFATDALGDALTLTISQPNGNPLTASWIDEDIANNGRSGAIRLYPRYNIDEGDSEIVLIRVRDSAGVVDEHLFTIQVAETNEPPEFVNAITSTIAYVGERYFFEFFATDPNGDTNLDIDPVNASLPDWLSAGDFNQTMPQSSIVDLNVVGPVSGGVPIPNGRLFTYQMEVEDPGGEIGTQEFEIRLYNNAPNLNHPGTPFPTPPNAVRGSGGTYSFTFTVWDNQFDEVDDNDIEVVASSDSWVPIGGSAVSCPNSGLMPRTCTFSRPNVPGSLPPTVTVTIRATDTVGAIGEYTFVINIP